MNRKYFEENANFSYESLDYLELYSKYKDKSNKYKTDKYKKEIEKISNFYKVKVEDSNLEYILERKSFLERKLYYSQNLINDTINAIITGITTALGFSFGNRFLYDDFFKASFDYLKMIFIVISIIIVVAFVYFIYIQIKKQISYSVKRYQKESFLRSLIEHELELINSKVNNYIKKTKK